MNDIYAKNYIFWYAIISKALNMDVNNYTHKKYFERGVSITYNMLSTILY